MPVGLALFSYGSTRVDMMSGTSVFFYETVSTLIS